MLLSLLCYNRIKKESKLLIKTISYIVNNVYRVLTFQILYSRVPQDSILVSIFFSIYTKQLGKYFAITICTLIILRFTFPLILVILTKLVTKSSLIYLILLTFSWIMAKNLTTQKLNLSCTVARNKTQNTTITQNWIL